MDGTPLFANLDLNVTKGDKITVISRNTLAIHELFKILNGESEADSGSFYFGQTMTTSYLPANNEKFFDTKDNLIDWLKQFSEIKDDVYVRGFLGKMLFTGEEVFKKSDGLSGGEKVRCLLSKMMLERPNAITLDGPTSHLDLESITAVNDGLVRYKGTLLFASHDHEFIQTVANRIIDINGTLTEDKPIKYDDYLSEKLAKNK